MPKKKKQISKSDLEDNLIIGYNSINDESPPNKKNKKIKNKKKDKKKKKKKKILRAEDGQPVKKIKTKKKPKTIKKKKKKKSRGILKKILKIFIKILIVLGIATGVILFLFVSPVFNIQEIKVSGANEISESVYLAMAGVEIGDNIFEIDKISGETTIQKEPYVEQVEIKRKYPNKIEINVLERVSCYVVEQNNKFFSLDKNAYILETSLSQVELPKVIGCKEDLENIEIGGRLNEEELEKFGDLIKIMDAIQNNDIDAKLTSIDITDKNSYIVEFAEENKIIMLGDASNLSAKMAWINLFIKDKKNDKRNNTLKFRLCIFFTK